MTGLLIFMAVVHLWVSSLPVGGAESDWPTHTHLIEKLHPLLKEKAARTPSQQKIGSRLLHALKSKGGERDEGFPSLRETVEIDREGKVEVEIHAEVNEEVLAYIEALGGTIIDQFPRYQSIRARLPLEKVETVAERPEVRFIRSASPMITHTP